MATKQTSSAGEFNPATQSVLDRIQARRSARNVTDALRSVETYGLILEKEPRLSLSDLLVIHRDRKLMVFEINQIPRDQITGAYTDVLEQQSMRLNYFLMGAALEAVLQLFRLEVPMLWTCAALETEENMAVALAEAQLEVMSDYPAELAQ